MCARARVRASISLHAINVRVNLELNSCLCRALTEIMDSEED